MGGNPTTRPLRACCGVYISNPDLGPLSAVRTPVREYSILRDVERDRSVSFRTLTHCHYVSHWTILNLVMKFFTLFATNVSSVSRGLCPPHAVL